MGRGQKCREGTLILKWTEKQWPERSGMRAGQCDVTEAKGREIPNASGKKENLSLESSW